jgi:hypothetical protein
MGVWCGCRNAHFYDRWDSRAALSKRLRSSRRLRYDTLNSHIELVYAHSLFDLELGRTQTQAVGFASLGDLYKAMGGG